MVLNVSTRQVKLRLPMVLNVQSEAGKAASTMVLNVQSEAVSILGTMFQMVERTSVDMNHYVVAEFVGLCGLGTVSSLLSWSLSGLNMLIAMITNSVQKIEDDADVDWKICSSRSLNCIMFIFERSNRGVVEGSFGRGTSYRCRDQSLVQRYIDTARREFEEAKRK
ncbi:unnamed protein product, partial [Ranitomeya imitator]